MSVQISALGFTDEEYAQDLQQQIQKAKYDAAVAAQAGQPPVIPARTDAPSIYKTTVKPVPAAQVTPYTMLQPAPQPAAEAPYYAAGATDLRLPPLVRAAREKAKRGIPWKTVGIVAGVVAVTGAVAYMMFRPTRGFRRPAMAGLAGHRRRRRHRR